MLRCVHSAKDKYIWVVFRKSFSYFENSLCAVFAIHLLMLFKHGSIFLYMYSLTILDPVTSYQVWVKACQEEAGQWGARVWALLTGELMLPAAAFRSPELLPLLLPPVAALPNSSVVGMDIPGGFIQKPPKPDLADSKNAQTSECI